MQQVRGSSHHCSFLFLQIQKILDTSKNTIHIIWADEVKTYWLVNTTNRLFTRESKIWSHQQTDQEPELWLQTMNMRIEVSSERNRVLANQGYYSYFYQGDGKIMVASENVKEWPHSSYPTHLPGSLFSCNSATGKA